MAGPLPTGGGARWLERSYRSAPTMPANAHGRPTYGYGGRPFSPSFGSGPKDGVYFYFQTAELAMLFKLAWGGKK